MSTLRSSSRSMTDQDLHLLARRRPSWTPSLSEHEGGRAFKSQSSTTKARHSLHNNSGQQRRPSLEWSASFPQNKAFVPSLEEAMRRARKPRVDTDASPEILKGLPVASPLALPESPEEGKGFRSSWEINVKDLVGDAVGNMSISPSSRDIVLAARRGLYIIDLESRLSIPRFLPQGGTWDVADVQWNPHLSHAQYIVSTSSEKLLIWNLRLTGKKSIEFILKAHYRAITDLNWHTSECDIVCSTGLDSWIWAWDIRTSRKPIFGLSSFKAGGTQVKWNYKDPNLLASAHSNDVLIWDRRKGSLPVTQIRAHDSKIYGIDWSRSRRDEIVTCSLDKSIKTWDINASSSEPKGFIHTTYPVWRARNLPFGEGILSLPQRGETTLEMYARSESQTPVETFEGHSDVVKEFVWRKGHQDNFQLITWSKDRTLRFWPVDPTVMEQVGYIPEVSRGRSKLTKYETDGMDTFSHEPEAEGKDYSTFSAPLLNRSILAEVRAPLPPRPAPHVLPPIFGFGQPTPPSSDSEYAKVTPTLTSASIDLAAAVAAVASKSSGIRMSKAGSSSKNGQNLDQLWWLASMKVNKRGSSSGAGSGDGSGTPSRLSSRLSSSSRTSPGRERSQSALGGRQRSGSLTRIAEDRAKDGDNQILQDEITSVLTKLAPKIKLEKLGLPKKRTCTLGLHIPWGDKSSVFIRVTFTFPRDYPQGVHPNGTPTVELERNPLIPLRDVACIVKHLRRIRENKRPCLEACLRFLLFADEGQIEEDDDDDDVTDLESSSDDDDQPSGKKKKPRFVAMSLLRSNKNVSEPRTTQIAFGPNGEMIFFSRAAPRIMQQILRGPSGESEDCREQPSQTLTPKTSYFQSPALVADAVRRLGLAASDRTVQPIDPRQSQTGINMLRAMTNLLTLPQHKLRRERDPKGNSYVPVKRSTVSLVSSRSIVGADQKVAEDYIFTAESLAEVCERNAEVARDHGRYDHERVFRALKPLFRTPKNGSDRSWTLGFSSDVLAKEVITKLYTEIAKEKDIQLLAMLAMLVLQTEHGRVFVPKSVSTKKDASLTSAPLRSRGGSGVDYFSLIKPTSPISSAWVPASSDRPPALAPSISSSNSSRGSWSSLFNAGTMRQFMTGVQDTLREGLLTPSEVPAATTPDILITTAGSPSSGDGKSARLPPLPDPNHSPRKKRTNNNSAFVSTILLSKSWHESSSKNQSARRGKYSFFATSEKRQALSRSANPAPVRQLKQVVFEPPPIEEPAGPLFDSKLLEQFKLNVYYYAELLFRWQMYHKRLELLNAVNRQDLMPSAPHHIGLHRLCVHRECNNVVPDKASACQYCGTPCPMPVCTVCRLPVKGLARTCGMCCHVTHVSCWNSLEVTVPICPSGCGCICSSAEGLFTRPSTRLGFTPPASAMPLTAEM